MLRITFARPEIKVLYRNEHKRSFSAVMPEKLPVLVYFCGGQGSADKMQGPIL